MKLWSAFNKKTTRKS